MYEEELDEDGVEYYAIRPNKSQLKRDIAELAVFAETLAKLPLGQLKQFAMDDELFKAVVAAGAMPPTGARKRQIKYICGLFRKMDIAPLRETLARLQSKSAHAVREHHAAERWRDQLLAGDDSVLTRFLAEFPQADRQVLRQLLRNAKKEPVGTANAQKQALLLYRAIKAVLSEETAE